MAFSDSLLELIPLAMSQVDFIVTYGISSYVEGLRLLVCDRQANLRDLFFALKVSFY